MNILNYGIIFLNENDEMVHFVGYSTPPEINDFVNLLNELKSDIIFSNIQYKKVKVATIEDREYIKKQIQSGAIF